MSAASSRPRPATRATAAACPCGSGQSYSRCCAPLHRGVPAPSAEALMRSRYSAYVKRLPTYLLRTWDPLTRPDTLELDRSPEWTRLEVLAVIDGGPDDDLGTVEFRAHHGRDGRGGVLHERSSFRRVDGAWCYVDGVQPEQRPGGAGSPRP